MRMIDMMTKRKSTNGSVKLEFSNFYLILIIFINFKFLHWNVFRFHH